MALSFTRKVNMSPGQRDTGDVIDAGDVNDLQEALEDISLGTVPIPLAGISGALGGYTGPWRGPHDCREWGIEADDNDHASDFATMVSELASEDNRSVQLVPGVIPVDSTINPTFQGLRLLGTGGYRQSQAGGSRLLFSGPGPLIEIGTDEGIPYDANDYSGPQPTEIVGVNLQCNVSSGGTTALDNGRGNYRAGTYGIRDWRGGDVQLRDVMIENFDYSFWGVGSDLDTFFNVQQRYSHRGIYIGPRSDQFNCYAYYGFFNDTAWHLDGCQHATFFGGAFVGDGAAGVPGFVIGSEWGDRPAQNITFYSPWFEHYQGHVGPIDAFVEIGVGAAGIATGITFYDPTILTSAHGVDYHAHSFVKVEKGDAIRIVRPTGHSTNLLDQLVEFVGATSPNIAIEATNIAGVPSETAVLNSGSGTPRWFKDIQSATDRRITGGGNPQLYITHEGRVGANADPHSMLQSGGSFATAVRSTTTNTSVALNDHTLFVDATAGAVSVFVYTAVPIAGREYVIKKTDASGNGVVIDPFGTETIDGATTKTITSQHGFLRMVSDGANWRITGQGGTIT